MAILAVIMILWALLCSLAGAALFAVKDGSIPGALFSFFIGWAPIALLGWIEVSRKNKREARWAASHAEMLAAAGMAPGTGFDHFEAGTGIALNRQEKLLVLSAGTVYKPYSYGDIREWSAKFEKAGEIVGVGLQGMISAEGANAMAAKRAEAATGLFVTARDIEHPVWRVAMADAGDRARWMEILRQELNEGGAGRAGAGG